MTCLGPGIAAADADPHSDAELMRRIADGGRLAFHGLARRHLPQALALAQRLCGNAGDADEIVQEAFLRLWRTAPHWRDEGATFATWFHRVIVNLSIDRHRRRAFAPLEDAGDPADDAPGPLALLERDQTARLLAEAVAGLPERQRTAVVLCYYEDMSCPDAADAMAVSASAVASLLTRARRTLRQRLERLGLLDRLAGGWMPQLGTTALFGLLGLAAGLVVEQQPMPVHTAALPDLLIAVSSLEGLVQ